SYATFCFGGACASISHGGRHDGNGIRAKRKPEIVIAVRGGGPEHLPSVHEWWSLQGPGGGGRASGAGRPAAHPRTREPDRTRCQHCPAGCNYGLREDSIESAAS